MSESGEKIRVMIVDDIPDTRDNLEKLLYFEKDIAVVGKAGTGREALAMAKQVHPDIVLMDINMPDMDGIAATEALIAQAPTAQVIMMSVQGESDYLRRAMLAGAREFLTKPISGDELVNSIRHVHRMQARQGVRYSAAAPPTEEAGGGKAGQIIAVFSPKGGVGTSTLACNLAVSLRLLPGNKKVALLDANLIFGDVGVMLHLSSPKTISDLVSRISDLDQELLNDVMVTHNSQVKVLLPPPNPQEGELVTSDHLRAILEVLRRQFDYVVVDTQSTFQDQTMAVLDMADRLLLVMTMEMTAIKNVKQFLEVAELLEYSSDKIMLVLNKADNRQQLRIDQVESTLKHKIGKQIGNAINEMIMAINQGVPLVIANSSHQISKDILALAGLLTNSVGAVAAQSPEAQQQAAQADRGGLFSRLRSKR